MLHSFITQCIQLSELTNVNLRFVASIGLLYLWDSPGKNAGVGCHALFQGIFHPRDQTRDSYLLHRQAGFLPPVQPGKPLNLTSLTLIFPGGSRQ